MPFDLNARIDVKNLKTNEIQSLSVKDLTDRNLTRLLKMYNQQVLGSAAMARFFNFKNYIPKMFQGLDKRATLD